MLFLVSDSFVYICLFLWFSYPVMLSAMWKDLSTTWCKTINYLCSASWVIVPEYFHNLSQSILKLVFKHRDQTKVSQLSQTLVLCYNRLFTLGKTNNTIHFDFFNLKYFLEKKCKSPALEFPPCFCCCSSTVLHFKPLSCSPHNKNSQLKDFSTNVWDKTLQVHGDKNKWNLWSL